MNVEGFTKNGLGKDVWTLPPHTVSEFARYFYIQQILYLFLYVEDINGKCTEINLLGWINGVVSVVIDVWMIGIPLSQIRKLELHWKKKIGAAIMFLTGTL
ncbi:hypothetical protein K4F52_009818 [Lecanicillium sp. MT-2017a]|nr:hypothetical protein K4F52_009818 [Lecanicillium sp. MT-2017a]